MTSSRFLLLLVLTVGVVRADATPTAVAANDRGDAPAGIQSGPYLSPPLPDSPQLVDSAEMVPPVSQADPTVPPPKPAPVADSSATRSVTINLIQLLVKRGLLSKADAAGLISKAEEEASEARSPAVAAAPATESTPDGMLNAPAGGGGEDSVDVAYVPDVVRNQIRDEVTADVMAQAREQGLTTKNEVPDWVHRFRITADIRTRYEGDYFPDGNATGDQVNFNAINTGAPFDINKNTQKSGLIPLYNVDQDRDRFRLRARLGAEMDLGQGFTVGMRLGTGSDDQPVSENQTLGGVNSSTQNQGGDFSKYQIWLDRAFLRYEWGGRPEADFSASVGRFDNPFFSSSMIWADDIGFDGFMVRGKYQVAEGVTPFGVAGAFPVFNTDLNFGTNSNVAGNGYQSEDKWLYAAQGGVNWVIDKDFNFKGAVAFYDFENIQGKVSDPISQDEFSAYGTNVNGDTDDSRPSFAQHGNTYIALRNVTLDPSLTTPTPVYEYFGLASKFQELALTGQFDYSHFDPVHLSLLGEIVDNVAFDRSAIENSGPAVLPGPQNNNNGGAYAGGNMGYNLRLSVGNSVLEKLWDWNLNVTYRYLESDAVVDGFDDSDFGGSLAGTNLQGFIVGGNLGITSRVWASLRFLSADSIVGPPLHDDVLQVDLNAKF